MRLHLRPAARSVTAATLPFLLIASLSAPLAGCGQKGPLVLPDTDSSDVVIRDAAGQEAVQAPPPERRRSRVPAVPAPTQAPSETAPRSTTPPR